MSWAAIDEIPGLERVSGTLFRATQSYGVDDRINCPARGGLIPHALPTRQLDVYDTYSADHVAALAAYDLVQVFTDGAQLGGGCGPGSYDCSSPELAGYYAGVSVELSPFGAGTEIRDGLDGTLRPTLYGTSNATPNSNGYLMRPTALEWDGQDPLNESNRTVWLPSEIIGIIGAWHIHHDLVNAGSYGVQLGSGVVAMNVISGSPRESTEEPVICFV